MFVLACILALASVAGAAEGRSLRTHGMRAARAPRSARASHAGQFQGSLPTFGPSHFHPVKPYKGFSYLEHEKHPDKD